MKRAGSEWRPFNRKVFVRFVWKEEETLKMPTAHFLNLWSQVWLCLQGNATVFLHLSACVRRLTQTGRDSMSKDVHTLSLGVCFGKKPVARPRCHLWDHITCMEALVAEMALLAFLKNTGFGEVDFSNFTKSFPGFAFFFFNGAREVLLSWKKGRKKILSAQKHCS